MFWAKHLHGFGLDSRLGWTDDFGGEEGRLLGRWAQINIYTCFFRLKIYLLYIYIYIYICFHKAMQTSHSSPSAKSPHSTLVYSLPYLLIYGREILLV